MVYVLAVFLYLLAGMFNAFVWALFIRFDTREAEDMLLMGLGLILAWPITLVVGLMMLMAKRMCILAEMARDKAMDICERWRTSRELKSRNPRMGESEEEEL